jgi:hypothetical protein
MKWYLNSYNSFMAESKVISGMFIELFLMDNKQFLY